MHSHETDHGETLRHNPPLSSGSARERAESEHRRHQRDFACLGERLQVARPAETVRKMVHGLRPVPSLVQKRVLERLFAALWEQQEVGEEVVCFGLDSTSVKVHPDGTGARKTNGPQSIGKSRGGWNTKIHIVAASDRQQ